MTYFNKHVEYLTDDEDTTEFENQIERENNFDDDCNLIQELHENMLNFVKDSDNSDLMQFSDHLQLMDIIIKGKFELKSDSHLNNTNDKCFIPGPIEFLDLDLQELELKSEKKITPVQNSSKRKRKYKKQVEKTTNVSKPFTGWNKSVVKTTTLVDIQNEQKNTPMVKTTKTSSTKTSSTKLNKGKYLPPSLR